MQLDQRIRRDATIHDGKLIVPGKSISYAVQGDANETYPDMEYNRGAIPTRGGQELAVWGELGNMINNGFGRRHLGYAHLHVPHQCRVSGDILGWGHIPQSRDQASNPRAPGHSDGH